MLLASPVPCLPDGQLQFCEAALKQRLCATGEADLPARMPSLPSGQTLVGGLGKPAGVYQGGSTDDLHKMLGVEIGGQAGS